MSDDIKMFLIMLAAVIAAGLILNYGDDLPVLEQAHEGFGG
ncbi:hypothetical protein [Kordiimonas sp.]